MAIIHLVLVCIGYKAAPVVAFRANMLITVLKRSGQILSLQKLKTPNLHRKLFQYIWMELLMNSNSNTFIHSTKHPLNSSSTVLSILNYDNDFELVCLYLAGAC